MACIIKCCFVIVWILYFCLFSTFLFYSRTCMKGANDMLIKLNPEYVHLVPKFKYWLSPRPHYYNYLCLECVIYNSLLRGKWKLNMFCCSDTWKHKENTNMYSGSGNQYPDVGQVHTRVNKGLTSGERVGLRGRGFLGGLSLCGVWGDLGGAAGGLPAGSGGRTALRSRGPPWGDGAGLRGRTTLTGWVPLGTRPGLSGRTSLLVWGSWDQNKHNTNFYNKIT